jgi:hypothetical protein
MCVVNATDPLSANEIIGSILLTYHINLTLIPPSTLVCTLIIWVLSLRYIFLRLGIEEGGHWLDVHELDGEGVFSDIVPIVHFCLMVVIVDCTVGIQGFWWVALLFSGLHMRLGID